MATAADAARTGGPDDPGSLAAITGRFAAAWQRGERPAIDDYLPASSAERLAVLPALVQIDLENRLGVAEMACVEAYLGRYPELAGDPATVTNLAVTEYHARLRRQPGLGVDEYFRRFPQLRDELARRLGSAPAAAAATLPVAAAAPAPEVASAPIVAAPATATPVPPGAPAPAPPVGLALGTAVRDTVGDWTREPERVQDAAMMGLFAGVLWGILCLFCLIASFKHPEGPALALTVTVFVGVVAAVTIWVSRLTRRGVVWALWAGLLIGAFETYKIIEYLIGTGFHFDAFMELVLAPLFLMALIQTGAYAFALRARYSSPVAAAPA